jgi:hypothetical protein
MADVIDRTVFEEMLISLPGYMVAVGAYNGGFRVSGYAGDDMLCDKHIWVSGGSVDEAVANYRVAHVEALKEKSVLKTPAAVKEAVIDLIREHDAAPASFRDAVDALRVSDR